MAAPTDVRVESTAITTTVLNWTYPGTGVISVYRSTDGSSYAEVTSAIANTRVIAGVTTYTDAGLTPGTKYWYKLSEDAGSNFSSVVTVYTQTCEQNNNTGPEIGLNDQELPALARRVEELFQQTYFDPKKCQACPSDGRVIIDCTDGCRNFQVIADIDINSVSIVGCDGGDGTVEFLIPPSVTRKICGFPAGFGFSGDECFKRPLITGTAGATMAVPFSGSRSSALPQSKPGYGGGSGSGGGGGGSACNCVPRPQNKLTIKSCNPNNSLKCSTTKKGTFLVCGGRAPYTWSKTGSGITLSRTTGLSVDVSPIANSGSGVAGDAYKKFMVGCIPALSQADKIDITYGCNDQVLATCVGVGDVATENCPTAGHTITAASMPKCKGTNAEPGNCNAGSGLFPGTTGVNPCTYCNPDTDGVVCDKRSAGMISANCNPCGTSVGDTTTLTVTDILGDSVTITLRG